MSLFQGIEQFRGQLDALNIQVVLRKDGLIGVTVTPVVSDKVREANPELGKSFSVAATAAELDAEFAGAIAPVATTRASLAEQAASAAASLKTKKPAAPTPKPSGSGKASGTVTFDDGGSDSDDSSDAAAPVAAPPAAGGTGAQTPADALFGDDE